TVYEDNIDVSTWLMSEKLDGVRGYWDGERLLSKNGNDLNPPETFVKNFPDFPVEGEIWGGRGTFERTVSIVRKDEAHDGWLDLKFAIFDLPEAGGGFEERLNIARRWFDENPSEYAFVIVHKSVRSKERLKEELQRVEQLGGEGLILRKPGSLYSTGRSSEVLKVKSYYDMEALVLEHMEGTGRNRGRMGSLLVELPDKTRFKIGTGFSDEERINPPPIGSIITFKYYGYYKSGIPKFPSFLRIRKDISLEKKGSATDAGVLGLNKKHLNG
ncbi:MAG: DNA ligase, partial [Nitrospirota bacterium]